MENLNFDKGLVPLTFNENPNNTVYFCPTDPNLSVRYKQSIKQLEELGERANKLFNESDKEKLNDFDYMCKQIDEFKEIDDTIKKTIDYIFNADICKHALGKISCLAKGTNGKALYENLIHGLLEKCNEHCGKKVNNIKNSPKPQKYLKKYNKR